MVDFLLMLLNLWIIIPALLTVLVVLYFLPEHLWDKVLLAISMLALFAFCGVVLGFVAEPDLAITTVLILALATHDFWITVFRKQEPVPLDADADLKQRYTGVSGKTLDTAKELEADAESSIKTQRTSRANKEPERKPASSASRKRESSARRTTKRGDRGGAARGSSSRGAPKRK